MKVDGVLYGMTRRELSDVDGVFAGIFLLNKMFQHKMRLRVVLLKRTPWRMPFATSQTSLKEYIPRVRNRLICPRCTGFGGGGQSRP